MTKKRNKKKLRIALIFGGTSPERVVSLRSGLTVAGYLNSQKYEIVPIEISKEGSWLTSSATISKIRKKIKTKKIKSINEVISLRAQKQKRIDAALLILHGPGGEDGTVQGMLELLGIPYTCSGVLASALAMDKARTKRILATMGVPVLPDLLIPRSEYKKNPRQYLKQIQGRVVVKPNRLGSSLGVTIAFGPQSVKKAVELALRHDDEVLVEPYAAGRELTVPVLGNQEPRALPAIEILPWKKSAFYDYAAKYEKGGSKHLIPAPLSRKQEQEIQILALKVHRTLGCKGVTRSDFILDKTGRFYFLEINTIPGMTPTSLVPQSAEAAGITFEQLLDHLITLALKRD